MCYGEFRRGEHLLPGKKREKKRRVHYGIYWFSFLSRLLLARKAENVCWKQRVPRAKSLDSRLLGFMGGPKNTYNEVLLLSSSCLPLLLCNAGMGLIPAKNASFLPFFSGRVLKNRPSVIPIGRCFFIATAAAVMEWTAAKIV